MGRSREWFKSMLKLLKDERKYWPLGNCNYALWQIYVVNKNSLTSCYTRFSWQRLSTEKITFIEEKNKTWSLLILVFESLLNTWFSMLEKYGHLLIRCWKLLTRKYIGHQGGAILHYGKCMSSFQVHLGETFKIHNTGKMTFYEIGSRFWYTFTWCRIWNYA